MCVLQQSWQISSCALPALPPLPCPFLLLFLGCRLAYLRLGKRVELVQVVAGRESMMRETQGLEQTSRLCVDMDKFTAAPNELRRTPLEISPTAPLLPYSYGDSQSARYKSSRRKLPRRTKKNVKEWSGVQHQQREGGGGTDGLTSSTPLPLMFLLLRFRLAHQTRDG